MKRVNNPNWELSILQASDLPTEIRNCAQLQMIIQAWVRGQCAETLFNLLVSLRLARTITFRDDPIIK